MRQAAINFRVVQHVRISKEKMKFAKGSKQNYTKEIFKAIKVVRRSPRPVYELEDETETADRWAILRGRTVSRTNHEIDDIQDR